MKRLYRSIAIGLSFLSIAALSYSSQQAGNVLPPESLQDLIKKIQPSVVNIRTDRIYNMNEYPPPGFELQFLSDFFEAKELPKKLEFSGEGTGVILEASGLILTNEHVISSAKHFQVVLSDKKTFPARLVGKNQKEDLALIKIDTGTPLQPIAQGDSDALKPGEDVFAIGTPYGYAQTVTKGIVSAVKREIKDGDKVIYEDMIQTDAALNPGNSGGPLLNSKGEMVGIVKGGHWSAQGISFAIPLNKAKRLMPELQTPEKLAATLQLFRSKFGFVPKEEKDADGQEYVAVAEIDRNSDVNKRGLYIGDRVTKFQDKYISSLEQLLEETAKVSPGQRNYFQFERQERSFFTYIEAAS